MLFFLDENKLSFMISCYFINYGSSVLYFEKQSPNMKTTDCKLSNYSLSVLV